MDCSNPVADSSRMTIASMRGRSERIARQNLAALDRVLRGKSRTLFEEHPDFPNEEGWDQAVLKHIQATRKMWLEKMQRAKVDIDLSPVCDKKAPIPTCGLLVDGIAVHPPGLQESKGKVANQLVFGGITIDGRVAQSLAQRLGAVKVAELVESAKVYTKGTQLGFQTRCLQQLGRPCVQISSQGYTRAKFFKLMDQVLPVDINKLPNWGEEINSQVDLLKTSFKASAGPPYWKKKIESIELLQKYLLPMVVDAIQADKLDDLFREQPELWLTVLKNKEDRYEDPVKKTRPYIAFPWHWQALFSCLSQPFCEAMYLFHEKKGSRNAYGFSFANGGGSKLVQTVLEGCPKHGDVCFFVYGDDVDFYVNIRGKIHRLCPDFKQMDGSVDATTIDYTIDYIIHKFEQKNGTTYSNFWRSVAEEWKMFATQPLMLLEGTDVYQKKKRDGLMTGVVGTTLFDTVKATIAYTEYVQALQGGGCLRTSLLKESSAVDFFAERGLVVKPGTWNLEEVNLSPENGSWWSQQKFLGVHLQWEEYKDELILVPALPMDDWLRLLLTPKRDEQVKTLSNIAKDRYLFDRMRGLLTTGAVFDNTARLLFNSILRDVDSQAIVMQVQSGEGKGAPPEFVNIVGDDFRFSSSMGWPTKEWALDLYAPPHLQSKVPMAQVFECGEAPFLQVYERPSIRIEASVVDVATPYGVEASVVLAGEKKEFTPPPIDASLMPSQVSKRTVDEPNKRSKLVDLEDLDKKIKRKPTIADSIRLLMQPQPLASARTMLLLMNGLIEKGDIDASVKGKLLRPDVMLQMVRFLVDFAPRTLFEDWWGHLTQHMLWPLDEMAGVLGIHPQRLETEARQLGYFVVGRPTNKWVVGVPLAGVDKQVRDQIAAQEKENVQTLNQVKKEMKEATVEKVAQLKKQEQNLHANVTRATQVPAAVMVEKGEKKLPILKEIPNYKIPDNLGPQELRICATDILAHNKLKAWRKEERDPSGWTHTFWVDGVPVVTLYRFGGKASWLYFYQMVVNTYLRDTNNKIRKGESWVDAADRETDVKVRVYKTGVGPILMQRTVDGPIELIQEHERLLSEITPNGRRVLVRNGPSVQELTLRSGTFAERTKRLERLLGEPVTFDYAPLSELSKRYNISMQSYGGKENKSPKGSKGRSKSGRQRNYSKAQEKQGQKEAGPVHDRDPHSSGKRERLFRDGRSQGRRQSGRTERTGFPHTACLDRNEGEQGSPVVATLETDQSPGGGDFLRQ